MGFVIAIIIILILFIICMLFLHGAEDPSRGKEQEDEEQLRALNINGNKDECSPVENCK